MKNSIILLIEFFYTPNGLFLSFRIAFLRKSIGITVKDNDNIIRNSLIVNPLVRNKLPPL